MPQRANPTLHVTNDATCSNLDSFPFSRGALSSPSYPRGTERSAPGYSGDVGSCDRVICTVNARAKTGETETEGDRRVEESRAETIYTGLTAALGAFTRTSDRIDPT